MCHCSIGGGIGRGVGGAFSTAMGGASSAEVATVQSPRPGHSPRTTDTGSAPEMTEFNSLLGPKVNWGPEKAGTEPKDTQLTLSAEPGLNSSSSRLWSVVLPQMLPTAHPAAITQSPFLPLVQFRPVRGNRAIYRGRLILPNKKTRPH